VEGDDVTEVHEPHAKELTDGEMMELINSEDCRRICTARWGGTLQEILFWGCSTHPDAAIFTV